MASPVARISQQSWRPLPVLIEQSWRDRFGTGEVDSLLAVLSEINLSPGPQTAAEVPYRELDARYNS